MVNAGRLRRRYGRLGFGGLVASLAGLVAGVAASPFVLLWHALGGIRRLEGGWVVRYAVLLTLATLWVRGEMGVGDPGPSPVGSGAWLARGMGSAESVAGVPYARYINEYSRLAGLDPRLTAAVIAVESSGNPGAVSPKGAMGLMQVMPGTWREVAGWEPSMRGGESAIPVTRGAMLDPETGIRVGTSYLAQMIRRCDGHVGKALIAYNAGLERVPYHTGRMARRDFDSEPARYVIRVYGEWDRLSGHRAIRSAPPGPDPGLEAARGLCWSLWVLGLGILCINCFRWAAGGGRRTVRW